MYVTAFLMPMLSSLNLIKAELTTDLSSSFRIKVLLPASKQFYEEGNPFARMHRKGSLPPRLGDLVQAA